MTACPERLAELNALLDGELDAANTLAAEAHLKGCEGCRAEFARLRALRETIAAAEARWSAPAGLRARVESLIEASAQSRPRPSSGNWLAWTGGAGAGAIAAGLAFVLIGPSLAPPPVEGEVVDGHVRSLLASHLTDVATSNQHLVKPWFNGRIDFAPPVPELAEAGFPLAGGRMDYIGGHPAAALVYRRRLHVINLFVWPERGPDAGAAAVRRWEGYSLLDWRRGGLRFWAVSDIDPAELSRFGAAFASRS